jgi:hypothetical protein
VATQPEQITEPRSPDRKPASLGDLARKITSRTTDFLAICIVLAASLTFGSQIVSWWHTAPPSAFPTAEPALAPPGWDDNLQAVDLEFGNLPLALTRQVVTGDQGSAVAALVRHCRSAVEHAPLPARNADEAEIDLLNRIAGLTPTAEEAGVWQVFVVDERFPLVVGVKCGAPAAGPVDDHQGRRLVCYGLAMPIGERSWTLFIVKGSVAGSKSPARSADIPLPPGAARTLSLRDERGSVLMGFSGTAAPEEWIKFYEDRCSERGWTRSDAWSAGNESWSARFARREGGWVDVRFAKDRHGELAGVLQVIP